MIVVKLIGGLGNQMFQYAAGKALAASRAEKLFLDTSYLKQDPKGAYTPRNFELGKFKIDAELAGPDELKSFNFKASSFVIKLKSLFPQFFKSLVFNESQAFFDNRFFKLPTTTYLNGYWQDENYFLPLRSTLLEDFDLKEKTETYKKLVEEVSSVNSVAVHVRRGDYKTLEVANKFHGVLPLDYYENAVQVFNKTNEKFTYFIFSDDLEWCRENFSFIQNAKFIDGRSIGISAHEELLIMAHCKHNIIANSSFSWWAAWLNNNKYKKIIAPLYWFNKTQQQPSSLIPSTWIRL